MMLELFFSFMQVGLFSIGGGYAAMPLIAQQVVDARGWLTMGEFTDLITLAEMTPGPIAINAATFVGIRVAGTGGAMAATFGCILPSLFIVTLLSMLYTRYRRMTLMQDVLSCLRPAVVALIASAGLTILSHVLFGVREMAIEHIDVIGAALFAAAFLALRRSKVSPIAVMCLCGAAGLALNLLFAS